MVAPADTRNTNPCVLTEFVIRLSHIFVSVRKVYGYRLDGARGAREEGFVYLFELSTHVC